MNTMFNDKLTIKDLEETLANSTALLAVVGAGDLAVEKIRLARDEMVSRRQSFDPKAFREQAQARFAEGVEALQTEIQEAPDQIRALPEKAQEWPAKAQELFADVVSTAFSTFSDLAGRGKTVVSQVRGERAVVDHVKPVSRPATSTASKTTTVKTAVKKPVAKKTTVKRTTVKKSAPKTAKKTTTTSAPTA